MLNDRAAAHTTVNFISLVQIYRGRTAAVATNPASSRQATA
jgi:hypothetical protein